MLIEEISTLLQRDLSALEDEIRAFKNEDKLWLAPEGVTNSAGNLCLHLVGNLNHFIGAIIGKTGYVRQRELEFSSKNIPATELLEMLKKTSSMIAESLSEMDESLLDQHYPIDVMKHKMTYRFFLIHLIGHLMYHRGQVNYLRRLSDKA